MQTWKQKKLQAEKARKERAVNLLVGGLIVYNVLLILIRLSWQ